MVPPHYQLNERRLQHAVRVAEAAVQSEGYANIVLAVANHTGVIWHHLVPGTPPVTWTTIFPLASITKPIVVTALMQLVERGQLILSDPVSEYIPEFGQHGKDHVTLWHLITHTSGLQELTDDQLRHLLHQRVPSSAYLEAAYHAPLHFVPGTQWSYGFLTYSVLGELITRLSGQPYPAYMQTHLFTPLGMVDTTFTPTASARLAANPHAQTPDGWAYQTALALPAMGLYSTADDIVTFGRAFLNQGTLGDAHLLSAGAVATMTRLHTRGIMAIEQGHVQPTYAALGWGMRSPHGNVLGSERAYGHAGASGSWVWVDPEWDLVFALLSNSAAPKPNLARRLLNAVYGALERS